MEGHSFAEIPFLWVIFPYLFQNSNSGMHFLEAEENELLGLGYFKVLSIIIHQWLTSHIAFSGI